MKRYTILKNTLIAVCILCLTTPLSAADINRDHRIITQEMGSLGFKVGKITQLKGNIYSVAVKGFSQTSNAVTLIGDFRGFTSKVSVIGDCGIKGDDKAKGAVIGDFGIKDGDREKAGIIGDCGILVRDKAKLERSGFVIKNRHLPGTVKIE